MSLTPMMLADITPAQMDHAYQVGRALAGVEQ